MEITQKLEDIFRSVFEDETIALKDEMTADDIEGWDSVAHISLIFAIEEEFVMKFTTADLAAITNVGDLRKLVVKYSAHH